MSKKNIILLKNTDNTFFFYKTDKILRKITFKVF